MASSGGEDEAMRALVREVGRRSVAQLGEGVTRIVGETSALYRWLLTMLAALNGAALWLCLARQQPLAADPLHRPELFFFAGLLAALLAAIVGMLFALPVARTIRGAVAHWTEVSVSGTLSDEAAASARSVRRMGSVWFVLTTLIALAALALFLLGARAFADGLAVAAAPVRIAAPKPQIPDNAALANAAEPLSNAAGSAPPPARQTPAPVRR